MKKASPQRHTKQPASLKDSAFQELLDAAEECHSNITALAQLLLWCDPKHLDPSAVPRAGYMILNETEKINLALQHLRKIVHKAEVK